MPDTEFQTGFSFGTSSTFPHFCLARVGHARSGVTLTFVPLRAVNFAPPDAFMLFLCLGLFWSLNMVQISWCSTFFGAFQASWLCGLLPVINFEKSSGRCHFFKYRSLFLLLSHYVHYSV